MNCTCRTITHLHSRPRKHPASSFTSHMSNPNCICVANCFSSWQEVRFVMRLGVQMCKLSSWGYKGVTALGVWSRRSRSTQNNMRGTNRPIRARFSPRFAPFPSQRMIQRHTASTFKNTWFSLCRSKNSELFHVKFNMITAFLGWMTYEGWR